MKISNYFAAAILASGVVFGGNAHATFLNSQDINLKLGSTGAIGIDDPDYFDIDFRNQNRWGSGHGQTSITRNIDGTTLFTPTPTVDVTVSAWNDTRTANSVWSSGYSTDTLYWDNQTRDGFGIQGGENDEIDRKEFMTVDFNVAVMLEGVYLTDLFKPQDGGAAGEKAWVELWLGTNLLGTYAFQSGNDLSINENNGGYYGAFGVDQPGQHAVTLDKVIFRSTGLSTYTNDEYSVAGFRGYPVTAIPLPAALPLYGTGLAVMGLIGWRKRRKAATA